MLYRSSLAVLACLALGCFQARSFYDGPKLLTTGPSLGTEAEMVRHFSAHDRGFYWFMGLVPMGDGANGAALAAREVGEHDGAVNLRLSDGQDLLDRLISETVCVLSLLCGSWSVWAEGDVVNVVGPPEAAWVDAPDLPDEVPASSLAVNEELPKEELLEEGAQSGQLADAAGSSGPMVPPPAAPEVP